MGMLDTKPAPTPMVTTQHLSTNSGVVLEEPKDYRGLLEVSNILLSPDQMLPTQLTSSHNLCIGPPRIIDADWAGDKDDYTSTMGHVVFLGRNPITWCSKKQKSLARSSTEAEYRSVATTTADIMWVQNLLTELGVKVTYTPVIYCDNLSATYLSANPVFHSKMKHLAVAFYFIREQVQNGTLRVVHVSTGDQLADFLTKPLSRPRLDVLLTKIGLSNSSSVLRGHIGEDIN